MRKSIASITAGAFLTTLSLFLLAITFPQLFALFGLLFVTSCVILGLSLIAVLPKAPALIYRKLRKTEETEEKGVVCSYCGFALGENAIYCPNCGAPVRKILGS